MNAFRRVMLVVIMPGFASAAWAQTSPGIVTGTGTATISRKAERMRLQIEVQGRDATVDAALKVLNTRIERARKSLAKLDAEKDSITVRAPRILDFQQLNTPSHGYVAFVGGGGFAGGGAVPGAAMAPALNPPKTVGASLTAEWKLDATDAGELLTSVQLLQQKIRAAELSGIDEEAPAADETNPAAQQIMMMQSVVFSTGQVDLRQPGYYFVSRLTDEEFDQAHADAYNKARRQAGRLAKAAGAQLGDLRSLTGQNTVASEPDLEYQVVVNQPTTQRANQLIRARRSESGENEHEALGIEPGLVRFQVTITASFDLKTK
jgi:uncharacterized protein YggE